MQRHANVPHRAAMSETRVIERQQPDKNVPRKFRRSVRKVRQKNSKKREGWQKKKEMHKQSEPGNPIWRRHRIRVSFNDSTKNGGLFLHKVYPR